MTDHERWRGILRDIVLRGPYVCSTSAVDALATHIADLLDDPDRCPCPACVDRRPA